MKEEGERKEEGQGKGKERRERRKGDEEKKEEKWKEERRTQTNTGKERVRVEATKRESGSFSRGRKSTLAVIRLLSLSVMAAFWATSLQLSISLSPSLSIHLSLPLHFPISILYISIPSIHLSFSFSLFTSFALFPSIFSLLVLVSSFARQVLLLAQVRTLG
jgi:hypothetical protein